jgi:hypothetical protein
MQGATICLDGLIYLAHCFDEVELHLLMKIHLSFVFNQSAGGHKGGCFQKSKENRALQRIPVVDEFLPEGERHLTVSLAHRNYACAQPGEKWL